jgi:hypothetical protein
VRGWSVDSREDEQVHAIRSIVVEPCSQASTRVGRPLVLSKWIKVESIDEIESTADSVLTRANRSIDA